MGDYAHVADKQLITTSERPKGGATPEIIGLMGKRFVMVNELEDNDRLNESRVKYCISKNTMKGRDLYEKDIEFFPTHKVYVPTNHRPRVRGTDHGTWRRLVYLVYGYTFTEDEKNERFRETFLDPERPGILNWLIAGFLEYRRIGLRPPASVTEASNAYKHEEDSAAQWIAIALKRDPKAKGITLKVLHQHYTAWMQAEKGYHGVSNKRLSESLHSFGYVSKVIHGVSRFEGVEFAFEAPGDDLPF